MNSFIVSLYVGYALYAIFPYTAFVESWGNTKEIKFFLAVLVYIVAAGVAQFAMRRLVSNGYLSPTRMIILGVLAACFLLALLYHVFGVTALFNLPSFLNVLFAPSPYFFYWFIAPLVGLYFVL